MTALRFHDLTVARVTPEAAGAVAITLAVPTDLRKAFDFAPGQFLTLRASIDGADVRRSYSISSARSQLQQGELELGIRPVEGGVFSNWAASQLKAGDTLRVMPPDGRFTVQKQRAIHRVGFAAGSGITPILSILATTLEEQPESKFTLVYGNRRMDSVMFNEALQDLKDRYPSRLTLIHILSRQSQEVPLLEGRINADKVRAIIDAFLPVGSMDEVFICGPEAMIEETEKTLLDAGVKSERIRTERFTSPTLEALSPEQKAKAVLGHKATRDGGEVQLTVVLDGKPYDMPMNKNEKILDIALALGLDLPYSCKGGVCCTCRCKVMEGSTEMDKNFTLEKPEVDQGFVLSCQARPTSDRVVVSFDER
ncbi:phenylacetic acid degradation protein [Limnohabitans sp. MMS-10A-160]|uniref:1,2-phenylacetyl-CoA epoxidase subunit PaaE n=1 Tax=unclassified Limnohabitans TaxID=2626134 RepID=UPI000D3C0405|nr:MULTISPECIES: 1,2-phenylacetyl-CoA epoxidase subunit PaaE [unclassified Limnohabitans]PUE19923.1 phenylacetic acid degradation protein [Limnohabitans sp. MMS-10A-192]PUE22835.1 phenylacetic acid degradation protein [Limnohabitans sp. MMS-10A-160]